MSGYTTNASMFDHLGPDRPEREDAWREFHARYAPVIAAYARHAGLPHDDIPDVVQSVILGFCAAQPSFVYDPAKGRFRGYLKACVRHAVAARLRARAGTRNATTGAYVSIHSPEVQLQVEDPRDDAAWNDIWDLEMFTLALRRVRDVYGDNPTFRAFVAVCLEGRPAESVAATLGVSIASVYQAKTRVMARLKAVLSELDPP